MPTPGVPDPGVRPPGSRVPLPAPSPGPAPTVPPSTGGGTSITDLIPGFDTASDIRDGFVAVRTWVGNRHNWTRVAWFGSGVVLFTVGAVMLTGRSATQAATRVATKGVTK